VFGALLVLPAHSWAGLTPEEPVSPNAEDSMTAYVVMGILATVLAIAVIAALIGAIRSREREEDAAPRRIRGTTTIQRGVGTVLASLAVLAFIFGVAVTEHASEVQPSTADGLDPSATAQTSLELPAGGSAPLEIDATAQQWLWRFEYPGGAFSYHELVVPVDTAVVLHLDSTDLIHRWSIPALGGAFDAVPGSENQTWFRADETGTYEGRSTAFSGPGYNAMTAKVTVLEPTEYEAWLTEQASAIRSAQDSVQEAVDEGTAPGVSVGEDTSEPLPEEGSGE
jgi:cytochrome c oxidase subunit 2